jgi:hypothetical protein
MKNENLDAYGPGRASGGEKLKSDPSLIPDVETF